MLSCDHNIHRWYIFWPCMLTLHINSESAVVLAQVQPLTRLLGKHPLSTNNAVGSPVDPLTHIDDCILIATNQELNASDEDGRVALGSTQRTQKTATS